MNNNDLLIFSLVLNFILIVFVVLLIRELSKYKNAIDKIDDIVSGLNKKPPAPDPRKKMEWKIKR